MKWAIVLASLAIGLLTWKWWPAAKATERGAPIHVGTNVDLETNRRDPVPSDRSMNRVEAPIAVADTASNVLPQPAPKKGRSMPASARTPEDVRDYIRVNFEAESLDKAWAKEARGTIEGYLTQFATERSHIESVACRTSTCEVKIVHDTEDDYTSFMDKAFRGGAFRAWEGELMVTRGEKNQAGSKNPMMVYLARPGSHLVAPE